MCAQCLPTAMLCALYPREEFDAISRFWVRDWLVFIGGELHETEFWQSCRYYFVDFCHATFLLGGMVELVGGILRATFIQQFVCNNH